MASALVLRVAGMLRRNARESKSFVLATMMHFVVSLCGCVWSRPSVCPCGEDDCEIYGLE